MEKLQEYCRGDSFIAGKWCTSSRYEPVLNPATGEPMGEVALVELEQVEQAVSAARAFADSGEFSAWRPVQRAELLMRIGAEIRAESELSATISCLENGKSLNDARDEILEAARYFEYYAGLADKIEGKSIPLGDGYLDYTVYEPVGVSVQIIPWNFPTSICARSLAPALAAGNAVIVKSPELSPLGMLCIARACERAGLPEGALSLFCGEGERVGPALTARGDIDQIVFTGSVPTGQRILHAAADFATPSVMELGGKSAAVVFADADLDTVIDSVNWGIFFNAGQVCSAMSRLLVERSIYPEVLERVTALANSKQAGAGIDNPSLTPVISQLQQQRVLAHCEQAVAEGARLLTGGCAAQQQGYFVAPTVFADVAPDSSLFQQEVFGPVIAITPFDSEQQAWQMANATDYGLVAGVFTQDLNRSIRASRALKAGQVFVNEWFAGGIETPFGGIKRSGFGREKGVEALYSYVRTKNVAIKVSGL